MDGISATYDALGRIVETVSQEVIYRPSGDKLALLNGSNLVKGIIPLPGGAAAVYSAGVLSYIRHKDWLGSSRLATTWGQPGGAHGIYAKEAYAPFGEAYNETGGPDRSFTGQDQDAATGYYNFMFRRLNPTSGRWLSPDPYNGSYDITNPQSFNRYAYVLNNPLTFIDPLGLDTTTCQPTDPGDFCVTISVPVAASYGGGGGDSPAAVPLLFLGGGRGGIRHAPNNQNCMVVNGNTVCKTKLDMLNPFHLFSTSYRDNKGICSTHVTVSWFTGRTDTHVDLFNPSLSPSDLELHVQYDVLPDLIYDITGNYFLPPGRSVFNGN